MPPSPDHGDSPLTWILYLEVNMAGDHSNLVMIDMIA